MSNFGHFEGEVIIKWLKDEGEKDRTMGLMADFSYVDPSGKRWLATKGRKIDGAGIPPHFGQACWDRPVSATIAGPQRCTIPFIEETENGSK